MSGKTSAELARENALVQGAAKLFPTLELECEGKRAVCLGGHEDDIDSINVAADGKVILISEWVLEKCLKLENGTTGSKAEDRRLTLAKPCVVAYAHQHVHKTPLLQWCRDMCAANGVQELKEGSRLLVFWWDMEHSKQDKWNMRGRTWWPAVYVPKYDKYGVWFSARIVRYDPKHVTCHIVYEYNQPDELEMGQVILPLNYVHFGDTPPTPGGQAQVFPTPWKPPPILSAPSTKPAQTSQVSGQQSRPRAKHDKPSPQVQVQPGVKDRTRSAQVQPQGSTTSARESKEQQGVSANGSGSFAQTPKDGQPLRQQQQRQQPHQTTGASKSAATATGKRDTSWRPDDLESHDQLAAGSHSTKRPKTNDQQPTKPASSSGQKSHQQLAHKTPLTIDSNQQRPEGAAPNPHGQPPKPPRSSAPVAASQGAGARSAGTKPRGTGPKDGHAEKTDLLGQTAVNAEAAAYVQANESPEASLSLPPSGQQMAVESGSAVFSAGVQGAPAAASDIRGAGGTATSAKRAVKAARADRSTPQTSQKGAATKKRTKQAANQPSKSKAHGRTASVPKGGQGQSVASPALQTSLSSKAGPSAAAGGPTLNCPPAALNSEEMGAVELREPIGPGCTSGSGAALPYPRVDLTRGPTSRILWPGKRPQGPDACTAADLVSMPAVVPMAAPYCEAHVKELLAAEEMGGSSAGHVVREAEPSPPPAARDNAGHIEQQTLLADMPLPEASRRPPDEPCGEPAADLPVQQHAAEQGQGQSPPADAARTLAGCLASLCDVMNCLSSAATGTPSVQPVDNVPAGAEAAEGQGRAAQPHGAVVGQKPGSTSASQGSGHFSGSDSDGAFEFIERQDYSFALPPVERLAAYEALTYERQART